MKLVNPIGRTAGLGYDAAQPYGCICSSGNVVAKNIAGGCSWCSCSCDYGPENEAANRGKANAKGTV